MPPNLIRDILEVLFVVAIGGMLWQVVGKIRRGEVVVESCQSCGRPLTRAYPACKHCGAPR